MPKNSSRKNGKKENSKIYSTTSRKGTSQHTTPGMRESHNVFQNKIMDVKVTTEQSRTSTRSENA